MFGPGARIIHPEFGDCTEDVIAALQEEARLDEPVILEQRQAQIAAESGRLAKKLSCGRLVAEIEETAFNAWESQRPGFFKKENDGLDYLLKHFPGCRVDYKAQAFGAGGTVASALNRPKHRVTSARGKGRWAA
jgi:hypothetical protein